MVMCLVVNHMSVFTHVCMVQLCLGLCGASTDESHLVNAFIKSITDT